MERLTILVGQLYKSVAPTKYFFKVPLVCRFMPLVGVIRRPVESPLYPLLLRGYGRKGVWEKWDCSNKGLILMEVVPESISLPVLHN